MYSGNRILQLYTLLIGIVVIFAVPISPLDAKQQSSIITPLNADDIQELALLTHGMTFSGDWSADGNFFYVASASGIWLYESDNLSAPPQSFSIDTTAQVNVIAADPDSRYLAVGYQNGEIILWQLTDHDRYVTLEGHTDSINDIAFSENGRWFASSSKDGTVRLWDVETGRLLHQLDGHSPYPLAVAFSPDSRLLATGGGNPNEFGKLPSGQRLVRKTASETNANSLFLWDVTTGQKIDQMDGFDHAILALAYSPDGTRIAGGDLGGKLIVWDVKNNNVIANIDTNLSVYSMAFTPDGEQIQFSTPMGVPADSITLGAVSTWEYIRSGEIKPVIGSVGSDRWPWGLIHTLRYSPDHSILAALSDSSVTFYHSSNYERIVDIPRHHFYLSTGGPYAVPVFTPDGSTLVLFDYITQQIVIWDTSTRSERYRLLTQEDNGIYSFVFSADGRLLAASAKNGTIQIWDLQNREKVATLNGHTGMPATMEFSPNGRWLVSSAINHNIAFHNDYTVRLWNIASETSYPLHTYPSDNDFFWISAFSFSADNRFLSVRDTNLGVHFYEVNTHQEVNPVRLAQLEALMQIQPIHSAFRRELYFAFYLDPQNIYESLPLEFSPEDVHWSSDGYLALKQYPEYDMVLVRNLDTGYAQMVLNGQNDEIKAKRFSPDGKLIVTAGGSASGNSHDNTLRLWDTSTGDLLAARNISNTRQGMSSGIYALSYSPDGRYIVTAASDGTIRLWGISPQS